VDEGAENLDMYLIFFLWSLGFEPKTLHILSRPNELGSQGHVFDYLNELELVDNEGGSCVVVPTAGSVISAAHER